MQPGTTILRIIDICLPDFKDIDYFFRNYIYIYVLPDMHRVWKLVILVSMAGDSAGLWFCLCLERPYA